MKPKHKSPVVYRTLFLAWREVEPGVFEAKHERTGNGYQVKKTYNKDLWIALQQSRPGRGWWTSAGYKTPQEAMHATGAFEATEFLEHYGAQPDDVYQECRLLAVFSASRNPGCTTAAAKQRLEEEDSRRESVVSRKRRNWQLGVGCGQLRKADS